MLAHVELAVLVFWAQLLRHLLEEAAAALPALSEEVPLA